MITLKGESILMNNMFRDTRNYLKYLALGTDDTDPGYTDKALGHEIIRTEANVSYNPNTKAIIMSADIDAKILVKTCEVGAFTNQGDLVSRDLFRPTTNKDTTATLEYRLFIEPMYSINTWKNMPQPGVYVTLDRDVLSVYERKSNSGYKKMLNFHDVVNNQASFYYDSSTGQLFIRTSDDGSPDGKEIKVLRR